MNETRGVRDVLDEISDANLQERLERGFRALEGSAPEPELPAAENTGFEEWGWQVVTP